MLVCSMHMQVYQPQDKSRNQCDQHVMMSRLWVWQAICGAVAAAILGISHKSPSTSEATEETI